jgi:ATP-dependent Lon protease
MGLISKSKKKESLPLLPLRNLVIFPNQVVPVLIERPYSRAALIKASQGERRLIVCMQRDPNAVDFDEKSLYTVGTEVRIIQSLRLPHGKYRAQLEGVGRVKIHGVSVKDDVLHAQIERMTDTSMPLDEGTSMVRTLHESFSKLVHLNPKIPVDVLGAMSSEQPPDEYVDALISKLKIDIAQHQKFLEMTSIEDRLSSALMIVAKEVEFLNIEQRIQSRIRDQIDQNQKEYYLNEKITAIQKELGDGDKDLELSEWKLRLEEERFPSEVQNRIEREIKRLSRMSEMSAEGTVLRSYLDWVFSVPWMNHAPSLTNLKHARSILDGHHYGLKEVKERILEQLAIQQLNPYGRMPILCLVGPPGVGKTSLAKSIAEATGRPYIRQAMGGIRDESEIRGHRRTYIGAMPGKLIQSLRRAEHMNLLLCLDEIDKMSMDRHHGDPASALLEALDPEQNHSFRDHYLDLDVDLSQVLFVCTANDMKGIPAPLLDRLEVIQLSSYTEKEKLNIAHKYLIPKSLESCGLHKDEVQINKGAVRYIIRCHTREAGVRELERVITSVFRKIGRRKVETGLNSKLYIHEENIELLLEAPKYIPRSQEKTARVGRVCGLGVSSWGGSVLDIEAMTVSGKGNILMTGRLGETLQESVKAGISYLRYQSESLDVPSDLFQTNDFHIHYPGRSAHADGPSAGVAMCMAILSSLSNKAMPADIGITGEISIHGNIHAVGGIKEKILAAHREGLTAVCIPSENTSDLHRIDDAVKSELTIHLVKTVAEVISILFAEQKIEE